MVAPSLVPRKPGERIKTDRRDALKLARLLRSGDLTPVWVPDEDHEALRDLSRARGDARIDVMRHRHHLSKFLLRHGLARPEGMQAWGKLARAWLQALRLPRPSHQVVLRDYLETVDHAESRLANLDAEVVLAAAQSPCAPVIAALQGLRGAGPVTAITLVAELGDLRRFPAPRDLMGYTGLVSREDSSAGRHHRGSITKTGNAHVRHVLVEAAWQYQRPPGMSVQVYARSEDLETAKYLSERLGTTEEILPTVSYSRGGHGTSTSQGQLRRFRPLLTPQGIRIMQDHIVLAFLPTCPPAVLARLDWRGHPPLVQRAHMSAPSMTHQQIVPPAAASPTASGYIEPD